MKTIQVNELNEVSAMDHHEANFEKVDAVMGGATLKSTGRQTEQYYKYELENILVSSYQIG